MLELGTPVQLFVYGDGAALADKLAAKIFGASQIPQAVASPTETLPL